MLGEAAIDETDWSRCFHAYTVATDTPSALRLLIPSAGRPPSEREVDEALHHLEVAVLHQGTIYPATAPSIRFLIGMVDEPTWRAEYRDGTILGTMLGFIGEAGESLSQRPADETDPPPLDPIVVARHFERLATGAPGREDDPGVGHALMVQGRADLDAALGEVTAALVPFVTDHDPQIRRAALAAVGWWGARPAAGKRRGEVIDAVTQAAHGTDRDERANAVLALAGLGGDATAWLDDGDPAIRACAALGLPHDPRATEELVEALIRPNEVDAWFVERPARFWGHVRFDLLASLLARGLPFERILPAALALVGPDVLVSGDNDWGPLLRAAFPDVVFEPGVRPPAPTDLTNAQRTFLQALVDRDDVWRPRDGNARLNRMRVGLPDTRHEVAALLATPPRATGPS